MKTMEKKESKKSKFKTCKKCKTSTILAVCPYCGERLQDIKIKNDAKAKI